MWKITYADEDTKKRISMINSTAINNIDLV